ncbi:MAG: putative DNA binding domain-containing protein [Thermoguttaceae bacterium]|nr:putative DNA binding domain-containing protein [Thermoguttaceae bacterium]
MVENLTTEFKREYVDDIKRTIVAFANTDGGKIYIGVNDDGSVRGVEKVDDVMLRVTNLTRDAIRPDVSMFTECEVKVVDEKRIVVLTVQRGTSCPYYLTGKGVRPEGVFVRQGASSVPASEAAILKMICETSGDRYEDERSLNQNLTFVKAEEYFVRRDLPFGERQKRTLGLIGPDGTFANLGMLLSDQCVHTIKAAVFEGSVKTTFRDRKELEGSLFRQLEDAYAYVDQFNRTRAEFVGLERFDRRDYPIEALREALLNAIVHRDYSYSASTLISIFDDRIEFLSIGGLVPRTTFADVMLGVSVLRNQKLADVFYRLKLIEAYGTGVLKIRECYSDADVKPVFEVSDNAFKVTLPNVNFSRDQKTTGVFAPEKNLEKRKQERLDKKERQKILLDLTAKKGFIVRKDVESELKTSQATAVLILREMVGQGMLIKEGSGRNSFYRVP